MHFCLHEQWDEGAEIICGTNAGEDSTSQGTE